MNEPRSVEISELMDQQRISGYHYRVFLLCALIVFFDGFDAMVIGYVAPVLSNIWKLKPGAMKDVMAAGLIGLMLGSLVFGPLGDKIGRRPVIIVCSLIVAVFTLLTITSTTLMNLICWRLLTGIGVGGLMPNAFALTSEYSPARRRGFITMVMFLGWNFGAGFAGVLAASLVPIAGWACVFWFGGLLPLVCVVVFVLALPESIRLLAIKGTEDERIRGVFRHINPKLTFSPGTKFTAHEGECLSGFVVGRLFKESRGLVTTLLWVMSFMGLVNLYFLANWLPTVINHAGISLAKASAISATMQAGIICGAPIIGLLLDRMRPFWVVTVFFFLAGVFVCGIGFSGVSVGLLILGVFAAGFFNNAITGGFVIATAFYPTVIRSSGVGWVQGIGRIGSIVGPWIGGVVLFNWQTSSIFLASGMACFVAAIAGFIGALHQPRQVGAPTAMRVEPEAG